MQPPVPGVRPLLGAAPVPHERRKKEVEESHLQPVPFCEHPGGGAARQLLGPHLHGYPHARTLHQQSKLFVALVISGHTGVNMGTLGLALGHESDDCVRPGPPQGMCSVCSPKESQ